MRNNLHDFTFHQYKSSALHPYNLLVTGEFGKKGAKLAFIPYLLQDNPCPYDLIVHGRHRGHHRGEWLTSGGSGIMETPGIL